MNIRDSAVVGEDLIARAPKVLLHDHLDGGLRPTTLLELADETGYALPAGDEAALADWFQAAADSGSLERYLRTFAHTVHLTQSTDALHRVAREAATDLAADGVVYAEVRFAPELHTAGGLSMDAAVDAVINGFQDGMEQAAHEDTPIVVGTLLAAMRTDQHALEVAQLCVNWRERGVAGFDIAGAEAGFPARDHRGAFELLRHENIHYTIHAGEAYGLPSIWEAVQVCGASRLGHGVRIVDDIRVGDDGRVRLGNLARYVRDARIALEMCPSSNVQTGTSASLGEHQIELLHQLGFRVTVNTDNRLMSATSMTREMRLLSEAFSYGLDDLERFTVNAMKSAFLAFPDRVEMIEKVIKPQYAALRAEQLAQERAAWRPDSPRTQA